MTLSIQISQIWHVRSIFQQYSRSLPPSTMFSHSVDPMRGHFVGDVAAPFTEESCCHGTKCCEGQKSFASSPEKTSGCNDGEDACCGGNEEMPRLSCGSGNGGACCDREEVKGSDDEDACRRENCCDKEEVKEDLDDGKLTTPRTLVELINLIACQIPLACAASTSS